MEKRRKLPMLRWACLFLMVGLLVGLFGFTGIAGASFVIAQHLFFVFVAIFSVMAALALTVFLASKQRSALSWHQLTP
jgi:uncharacterized membrane protein YtjA (UPF0391 family)